MPEVAPLGRLQPLGEMPGLGMVCEQRGEPSLGELEELFVLPERIVGIEAYEAAGGVLLRDLFDDRASAHMENADLLERLAIEGAMARPGGSPTTVTARTDHPLP